MKISIVSLGCSKNLVDSEIMTGALKSAGHELSTEENAEVIIVNTCGFIGDAKRESVETILELSKRKEEGSCRKLIVTGCLVERYSKELSRELPEVDAFWGTGNLLRINEALNEIQPEKIHRNPPGTLYDPDTPRVLLTPAHYAYVKVSEGCSRTCSFCIIPKMRGTMKSRQVESIAGEVSRLAGQGVREINLIAQDMTSYGRDIGTNLEEMLMALAGIEGVKWIRIHYCYPWGLTDSLIGLIADEEKILPYIDMPLQHISDRILGLMDRKTPAKRIRDIIHRLKSRVGNLTLRTTFIVGFPGETEEEFEELLEFVAETGFDRAGAFKYSREEGTPAGAMTGQIPEDVKEERYERLMQVQSEVSLRRNESHIGTIHEGFIEGRENGNYIARIASQAPEVDGLTYVKRTKPLDTGDLVRIKITGADIYDLHGEVVPE
ncbi:MAG: 30S ribosomal protein S12 methylthiotransferase RimO [Thermodesulfobacteriota bacterium]